jgi:imidazolonepropionase-like amidohydrolase
LVALSVFVSAHALGAETIAFVGVNVVTMEDDEPLHGYTVVVRDGSIESIGPMTEAILPDGARVIYASGRWMMPGLIDMHAHIRAADVGRYIASGVTTVRDMAGLGSVLTLARQIESGELTGPRIIAGTRLIDGPNPANPFFSVPLPDAAAAESVVDGELARGCRFVKVYDNLTRALYDAVVAAARERGVKVAGHVPRSVALDHALASQDCIEHLSGYSAGLAAMQASATRDAGVWNCPTMYVFSASVTAGMAPADRTRVLDARRAVVRALSDAGARILAGTDGGYLVPAGTSLVEELEELRAAGLTHYAALRAATRDAAEYLEISTLGVIREDAAADLILLDANPLEAFDTLRRPVGVVVRGEWHPLIAPRRRAAAK